MGSIYVRGKNAAGQWSYSRAKSGKGQRTDMLRPPFYFRRSVDGKQTWMRLDVESFDAAKREADRVDETVEAQVKLAADNRAANRIPIISAVTTYLDQKSGKAAKTLAQYRLTLNEFIAALDGKIQFLDEITEEILRSYQKFMVSKGHAAKTCDTRLNIVFFLLKKNGITARVPRDEMPVVEEETAVPYTETELKNLFAAMNDEEKLRYRFFLGSGCREREVSYAAWNDIDFDKKTYHVRRKEDDGFTPKNHESRTIPLPDSLVTSLHARRKSAHGRWIFANEDGRPEGHFLRKLKSIALRAKLNCGQCRAELTVGSNGSKRVVEVSCATNPVCEHFILHRFRKTCATRWSEAGVPVRTIQAWLGHKNLETTQRYLGVTASDKLRGHVNTAFGD